MAIEVTNIVGNDPATGLELVAAVIPTGSGNALVTSAVFTGVLEVNLDLANDEVCIGTEIDTGPAGTRALNQGRLDGTGNAVPETVPRLIGLQTSALGKVEDTAAAGADVGVAAYRVREDAPLAATTDTDGDYQPSKSDDVGADWVRERKPTTLTPPTHANVIGAAAAVQIVAANDNRHSVIIRNLNAAGDVGWIGADATLTQANGMPLEPPPGGATAGESITLETTDAIFGFFQTNTGDFAVLEQTY